MIGFRGDNFSPLTVPGGVIIGAVVAKTFASFLFCVLRVTNNSNTNKP